jgi:CHAT domain-containing protein
MKSSNSQLFPEAVTLLKGSHAGGPAPRRLCERDSPGVSRQVSSRQSIVLGTAAYRWVVDRACAHDLDLRQCGLVVLSACETGLSALAPGDDLIGLARGFFLAGALSLVVSLWTVDDETTAQLMSRFYTRLLLGDGPAAALRAAQCHLLKQHPHPFFWSPFISLGRW